MQVMQFARKSLTNAKREYKKAVQEDAPIVSIRYWIESIEFWEWTLNRKAV